MRILFLSQVLPYPVDAGPKVRSYYTLRHLSRNHEVCLIAFARSGDSAASLQHLRSFCASVNVVPIRRSRTRDARHLLTSLVNGEPFLIARDRAHEMASAIRAAVAEMGPFDVVHADQLWMARYALLARAYHGPVLVPKVVLDQHNAVFEIPQRMAFSEDNPVKRALLELEALKLARYEAETCSKFDRVAWVTAEDRSAMQARGVEGGSVIPIAIDTDTVRPLHAPRFRPVVTFLGGLHWPPNAEGLRWFLRGVWPLVRSAVPDAVCDIIGQRPPKWLRSDPVQSVNVLGYVAEPEHRVAGANAFIVPLLAGGGMRVKILHAWAWGTPVVSTTIGAEGVAAQHGKNALIADTPEGFAASVIHLLRDPDFSRHLAREGRRTVEEHYNWRRVYRAWDEVYACVYSSSPRMCRV